MAKQSNYHLRREQGLCPRCGKNNATPEKSMCPTCRENFNRKRRENSKYLKKIGICVRCGKNKSEPNKTLCMECIGAESDKYHNKSKDLSSVVKIKERYRKRNLMNMRRVSGLCYRCGKHKVSSGEMCSSCKAYLKQYRYKNRADIERSEWPNYGICYLCGKAPIMKGKKVCASCYKVRMRTIPTMLANQNNEYFRKLNMAIFSKKEEITI
ncbi:hypothetical protein [Lacrimispora sp.]|uniref:hypothetical protein n=1 Tax=Lacrimispora sp. TaxID=2719234 RepID=UPI00399649A0